MIKPRRWPIYLLTLSIAAALGGSPATQPATAPTVPAQSDPLLAATPITLHVKNAAAADVYAEIFRQAHLPLKTDPANLLGNKSLPPLSIDADRQPFWQVMQTLALTGGINLEHSAGSDFLLFKRDTGWKVWSVSGAVCIVPTGLWYRHEVPLDCSPAEPTNLYVGMIVKYEPKLPVTSMAWFVNVQEAVDDHGNSLVPDAPPSGNAEFRYAGFPYCRAELKYPPHHAGKKIVRLRGTIAITVATRTTHVEIPGILKAQPAAMVVNAETFRFLTCQFQSCLKTDDGYEVKFSANAVPDETWEQIMADLRQYADAFTADGEQLQRHDERQIDGPNADRAWLETFQSFRLPPTSGVPATLVIDVPLQTRDMEFPFEFRDLNFEVFER